MGKTLQAVVTAGAKTNRFIEDYYRNLEKQFNDNGKLTGFNVDFSEYYKNPNILSERRRSLLDSDGRVWEETAITCQEVIKCLVEGRNIGLLGLVQSAKTATQIISGLFACVAKYNSDGRWTHPIFMIPNQKGTYLGQFKTKFNELYSCISHVKITYKGKTTSLIAYLTDARDERTAVIKDQEKSVRSRLSVSEWNSFKKIKEEWSQDDVLILPMSAKIKTPLHMMFVAFGESSHRTIINRDEAHSAVGENSVNDKLFHVCEFEKSIYESINRTNGDAVFMATSATNWASLHLDLIPLRVNSNYTGIDFGYEDSTGVEFQVAKQFDVKIKSPEIFSMSEFSETIDSPHFMWVRPHWYKNEDAFLKHMEINELQYLYSGHRDYRKKCSRSVAKAINHLLFESNDKGHRGMLVRFVNDNKEMDNFLSDLKPHLNKVKIVKEYGDNHESIKDLLELNGVGPDDFYVIFATAGARMSDSFPKDCGFGLDLTNESTTLTAILQGVLGRMCGYYKEPVVVLSDANTHKINEYIENDNLPTTGMNVLANTKTESTKSYQTFRALDYRNNPIMTGVFDRIQEMLDNNGTPGEKNGKKQVNLGKNVPVCFFDDCLTFAGFEYIQSKCTNRRLMGKFDEDDEKRTYYLQDDRVVMTVRAEGKDRHQHFGGRPGDTQNGVTRLRAIIRVQFKGRSKRAIVSGFDLVVYRGKAAKINSGKTVPGKIFGVQK